MDMRDIALGMAKLCVRNTIIEQYHADGKISDSEMKAFNKEVANKLYTALSAMTSGDRAEADAAFMLFVSHRPANWDSPEIDQGMHKALARIKRECR